MWNFLIYITPPVCWLQLTTLVSSPSLIGLKLCFWEIPSCPASKPPLTSLWPFSWFRLTITSLLDNYNNLLFPFIHSWLWDQVNWRVHFWLYPSPDFLLINLFFILTTLRGMWDLCFPTREQTFAPSSRSVSLNPWTARKVLITLILNP